jgi:4-hydroxy-2-oxoheptanedioate aldolase
MGHLADASHPEVQAAIANACARIRAAGKAAGMLTGDPDAAARYLDLGFSFVAVGSDVGVLGQGALKLATTFKRLVTATPTAQG